MSTRRALAPVRLPRDARERIVDRYPSGAKCRSQFHRHGKLVADVEWWDNGHVSFIEPCVDRVPHGIARHYDEQGVLLLETRYVRGTGVDLWCDLYNRTLSEETRIVRGCPTERRWWNPDERTVYREELWGSGDQHGGIDREWNHRGRLRRGYPQYFVQGQRVDRKTYERAARVDRSLPRISSRDDGPTRRLPREYVGQPVHREHRTRRG